LIETKLKRRTAHNLATALAVCIGLDVPAKFRYAIRRNLDSLAPDMKATNEAYPEPKRENEETYKKWESEINVHMEEEITVSLHMAHLPEINDTRIPEGPQRSRQNQGIVEGLMPIIRE
jgi:hypothetical protein